MRITAAWLAPLVLVALGWWLLVLEWWLERGLRSALGGGPSPVTDDEPETPIRPRRPKADRGRSSYYYPSAA